jgi:ethanolamine permease
MALILGGVVGFLCALAIDAFGSGIVGAALLNMAVFGAVISYALVMISYIKLKVDRPDLPRPYVSPLGIPGAAIGALLAIIALFACFSIEGYRPGVWGTAIFLAICIVFYFVHSSKHLVAQAPEEEVALMSEAQKELAH